MASRVFVSVLVVALVWVTAVRASETGLVPIIYSTDLHHPHMDPDDHFDLATLFAIPEFDIRAIVLDCGSHQLKAPGRVPVEQMLRLTGRKIPFAIGLGDRLSSPEDAGLDQAERFQHAVRLILDTLRRSTEQVCVFTTGSVRDVAAAFNREPELLRAKVKRLYINIGNPAVGDQSRKYEYNVNLDRNAYVCVMNSGLPVYWCPCFDGGIWDRGRFGTYWKFQQSQVLEHVPRRLQNWFIYALTKPPVADPIAFLSQPQQRETRDQVWKMPRNMWCTAPFLHAAGRRVYAPPGGEYVSLSSAIARQRGIVDHEVDTWDFVPMQVAARRDSDGEVFVKMDLSSDKPNGRVFRSHIENYDDVLTACLRQLLAEFESLRNSPLGSFQGRKNRSPTKSASSGCETEVARSLESSFAALVQYYLPGGNQISYHLLHRHETKQLHALGDACASCLYLLSIPTPWQRNSTGNIPPRK